VTARKYLAFIPLFSLFALAVVSSHADHAPNHWPDGAIVYGDWGLYRPGHMAPIYEGPLVIGAPRNGTGYYFPTNRNDPSAYRSRAVVPHVAEPAEPWSRTWGTQSEPANPTVYAPFDPPEVIYAPRPGRRDHGGKNGKHKKTIP